MKTPDVITIHGVDYVKCVIPPKAWDDCLTPCTFCHSEVQKKCTYDRDHNGFCMGEHVCYIDFNEIDY